ncbi:MAG: hypothetical protein OEU92_11200 [Alphaproteobacteria bacterium]|nr:hypothetical protein [Alphaproteobacteria bacterium]
MVQALLYWLHAWCHCVGKLSTHRQVTVLVYDSCGEMRPVLKTMGCRSAARKVSFSRRFEPSGRHRACLASLYFARLAGFLPAVLPGMIEGAELVADGLGLTALGFLASRLLRFWLLAMSFSVSVDELGIPDLD